MSDKVTTEAMIDAGNALAGPDGIIGTADDVFEGKVVVPGLEVLGRAIVDANGIPSGSPANYEHMRGKSTPVAELPDAAAVIADLRKAFELE